jgi:hypothetical protein
MNMNRKLLVALPVLLAGGAIAFIGPHGVAASGAIWMQPAGTMPPLSANDVSWLFPPPKTAADTAKLIAVSDLMVPNAEDATKRDPVWSDTAFQQFVAIATSDRAQVAGTRSRIALPAAAKSKDAWFVAGVRIDAGAPGLSSDVRAQFGQSPQIRLIVQPVSRAADGTVHPLDIAAHLVFNFVTNTEPFAQQGCSVRPVPDMARLRTIVADLGQLRTKLSEGGFGDHIATAGAMGVHPGLANATTAAGVRQEMKAILERHLLADRMRAMAVMSVPANQKAPWIFLAMQRIPTGFVPVPSPTLDGQQFAQMFTGSRVVPAPSTNNLNPITCKHAALSPTLLPVTERKGSATAELFVSPPLATDKTKDILDRIADPTKSHFFNTDCVSCHTETRRAMTLLRQTDFAGIDPGVLPNGDYNTRNFGWSPEADGPVRGTISRRTAAETAEVVAFINAQLLSGSANR